MSRPPKDGAQSGDWPGALFAALKRAEIRHVAYVPDAGHAQVIARAIADPALIATALTTEEEGIGLLLGAWLGGQRGVLLMQSSGVGNCINALSLHANVRFPLPLLVTMRGEWAEFNPWQVPMGRATQASLELMGVSTSRADKAEDVEAVVAGALDLAFNGECATAVLLGQRLIGRKVWIK
ncbi:MAG: phosphonopyruvate decarboxylase [Alphaproteobacteria bacterium]|nr:phosphonopyruvate decarboxylase [Alphaproteobacteria bacterium]